MEVEQFATRRPAWLGRKRSGRFGLLVVEEIFGQGISKGLDHVIMLSEHDNSVKIKLGGSSLETIDLLNLLALGRALGESGENQKVRHEAESADRQAAVRAGCRVVH